MQGGPRPSRGWAGQELSLWRAGASEYAPDDYEKREKVKSGEIEENNDFKLEVTFMSER